MSTAAIVIDTAAWLVARLPVAYAAEELAQESTAIFVAMAYHTAARFMAVVTAAVVGNTAACFCFAAVVMSTAAVVIDTAAWLVARLPVAYAAEELA